MGIGTILGLVLPAIPSLVTMAESLFSSKAKSGPDKLNTVLQTLQVILGQMAAAGLPGAPTQAEVAGLPASALQGAIETVLANLKATGQLTAKPVAGTLWLVQGSVTALQSGVAA